MVSEQQATEESGSQPENNAPSPGKMLRERREALGRTQKEVADKIFLKPGQINELENDELDSNASITFTKGYVRNYAKYLGLDSVAVVSAFEQRHKSVASPAPLQSFSRRVAKQTHDDRWMLVTYIILLLIIGGIVVWWLQQPNDEGIVETSLIESIKEEAGNTPVSNNTGELKNENAMRTSVAPSSDNVPSVAEERAGTFIDNPSSQGSGSEAIEGLTDAASVETGNANAAVVDETNNLTELAAQLDNSPEPALPLNDSSTNASPIMMTFTFSEDCWVNIKDATGEDIAYGVKKSGRIMEIQGIPPVEVTLGAADNVRIHVNGEPIDLSAYDNSRTARFSLPM